IGSNVLNLQFSFFSAYVFMFAIGVVARSVNLFEQINYNSGKRYLIVSLALGIPLWTFIILNSGALDGIMLIEGGWNWPAFAYALWESFFCVTFIIALIGLFKRKMNIGGSFQKFLSDNAFGVFVFHTPVLIATSMLLREVAMHPVLKFFMVSAIAVSASFITAWMVRRPKFLRRIFT
ncbi:MAG TPA: acyltransferase family protein, partial [Bacteroidales bacterium]|nr:acyltransferase family protein [Bacteroidales bacterium]